MRPAFVGGHLRTHGLVADLAAELRGLGVVLGLVTARRTQDKEHHSAGRKGENIAPLPHISEIELPAVGAIPRILEGVAPLQPRAAEHQGDPRDEKNRRDEVGEDAEIRILLVINLKFFGKPYLRMQIIQILILP